MLAFVKIKIMINVEKILSQIKHNCNISDARFWGTYSLCGLLLRLRELYRIENGLLPWEKPLTEDVGRWINEREELWRKLQNSDLTDIKINGDNFNAFDERKINNILNPSGLLYGAGYGLYMKPVFFIAEIISHEKTDGYDIYIAGREYARDLSDYPAMLQNKTIISRFDMARLLIWNKFEEMRCKNIPCRLSYAFGQYGLNREQDITKETYENINQIALSEAKGYIYHELGEAYEGKILGEEWKQFLLSLPHSSAEVFVRSVKDVLSDTSEKGMLKHIIENEKSGSLGFYNVFLSGFRKIIFPEMAEAFEKFRENKNWDIIEKARKTGYEKTSMYSRKLLDIYHNHKSDINILCKLIEQEINSFQK
ncbi:MAG: hypothetical protein HXY52_09760 [Nitrospirae bacterium]|jgi:hypothetical protein|nr:hypothetical protein [Nitrospirota bacterium]